MREGLAERLLAEVMHWSPADVARERPILQALASYKYDEYEQFSPGMHFIESLAIWLSNFDEAERPTAYDFVTNKVLFVSEAEMRHLVGLTYPDYIRHILLQKAAADTDVPGYAVAKLLGSDQFNKLERKSLFLGLSDGARVDVLRRKAELSNEQVHATYQLSDEKASDMVKELRDELGSPEARFENLFLIDDFSGSGDSLLREEEGELKGKTVRCLSTLLERNERTELLDVGSLSVYVVLYMCTSRAMEALNQRLANRWRDDWPKCSLLPVHVLGDDTLVTAENAPEFDALLYKYYDCSIMDRHLLKGGPDVIHGYGACSLPLVLTHNAPNNSVYLLWADKPGLKTKALFPRVSRHREE